MAIALLMRPSVTIDRQLEASSKADILELDSMMPRLFVYPLPRPPDVICGNGHFSGGDLECWKCLILPCSKLPCGRRQPTILRNSYFSPSRHRLWDLWRSLRLSKFAAAQREVSALTLW